MSRTQGREDKRKVKSFEKLFDKSSHFLGKFPWCYCWLMCSSRQETLNYYFSEHLDIKRNDLVFCWMSSFNPATRSLSAAFVEKFFGRFSRHPSRPLLPFCRPREIFFICSQGGVCTETISGNWDATREGDEGEQGVADFFSFRFPFLSRTTKTNRTRCRLR